jgi:hypothetical protein
LILWVLFIINTVYSLFESGAGTTRPAGNWMARQNRVDVFEQQL